MNLKKIFSQGELETVEFKKSLSELKEIIKTISAFFNTIEYLRREKNIIRRVGKGKDTYYIFVTE